MQVCPVVGALRKQEMKCAINDANKSQHRQGKKYEKRKIEKAW
jgi:hypothetical protein